MVAVGYERLKGLRVKNQKADGFEVSASRTFDLPVSVVYETCIDSKNWVGEALRLRTSCENKSMRVGAQSSRPHWLAWGQDQILPIA